MSGAWTITEFSVVSAYKQYRRKQRNVKNCTSNRNAMKQNLSGCLIQVVCLLDKASFREHAHVYT